MEEDLKWLRINNSVSKVHLEVIRSCRDQSIEVKSDQAATEEIRVLEVTNTTRCHLAMLKSGDNNNSLWVHLKVLFRDHPRGLLRCLTHLNMEYKGIMHHPLPGTTRHTTLNGVHQRTIPLQEKQKVTLPKQTQ